jgi:dihydrofolate reductase
MGDEPWQGWWGDDPPFHLPVFVLTHHAREPLTLSDTTFTFVTDGIESALEQAREAAGDRGVKVAGGASIDQQHLKAGLVDELQIHVAPLLLGGGTRRFGELEDGALGLEQARVSSRRP